MQACLQDRHLLCALLSCMAVLFRQTNAVWVCFILGVSHLAVGPQQLAVHNLMVLSPWVLPD